MAPEDSLIPFEATELTGARILVLAAHPDDETLGRRRDAGAATPDRAEAIRIWIATDGTGQEGVAPGGRRRSTARGGARRPSRAAAVLGVERAALRRASPTGARAATGGGSTRRSGPSSRTSGRTWSSARRPSEIHPDHRALARSPLRAWSPSSRAGDPDHDHFRFLRIAFYELSHPLLPNTLVDIAAVARPQVGRALAPSRPSRRCATTPARSQGLNAYRRLTLPGRGPVEAFRVRVLRRGLDAARSRSCGARSVRRRSRTASRGLAPVAWSIRTRNRPALLREALESLRAQTARPTQVVVVNDGGASPREVTDGVPRRLRRRARGAPQRLGRSAAANRGRGAGAGGARRLSRRRRPVLSGPPRAPRSRRTARAPSPSSTRTPSRSSTARAKAGWEPRVRTLQYSLDFDPDYLLLANYIPIHTLLAAARALPEGRRLRRGARLLRGLGLSDPAVRRDVVPAPARRDLRVPRVRAAVGERSRARRVGGRGLPGRAPQDLRALRGAAHGRGPGAHARPHARADRLLVRPRRIRRASCVTSARATGAATRRSPGWRPGKPSCQSEKARLSAENELAPRGARRVQRAATRTTTGCSNANVEIERLNGILQQIYDVEDLEAAPVPRPAARATVTSGRRRPRPEPIRPRMAGMGIRALELARALAREFDVRLLVPNDPARGARGRPGRSRSSPRAGRGLADGGARRRCGDRVRARGQRVVPRGPGRPGRRGPLRPLSRREPPLRRRARRGDRAPRPRDARARARARGLLPLRVAGAAALLRRRALSAGRIGRGNFPGDPALERLLAIVPFGVPAETARGRPGGRPRRASAPRERAARPLRRRLRLVRPGAPARGVARDPAAAARARACSSSRIPTPRRRRSASSSSARERAAPVDPAGALDPLLAVAARTPSRADLYAAADLLVSISSAGLETELAYRTRLLDAAWGGVPSVSVGGGTLARELVEAGAAFESSALAA